MVAEHQMKPVAPVRDDITAWIVQRPNGDVLWLSAGPSEDGAKRVATWGYGDPWKVMEANGYTCRQFKLVPVEEPPHDHP